MSQAVTISGLPCFIDGHIVRESVRWSKMVNKMKNRKVAGPPGAVSEMVKTAGEVGVDMIWPSKLDYSRRSYSSKWELSTTVNCYKGKGDSLERGNYRGLKLIDQIPKKAEK